ncbi:MAG: MBL fold metallo-hydrolase [Chromatiales bacterium]|jgi:glyoxylase-like metal-dependent hydrolase (beta-lactamase superfamily II)
MRYLIIPVTPFEQNCTLLWCEQSKQAAIVDPGGDIERIRSALQRHGLQPVKILLTHGHIDHAGGTAALSEQLEIPVEGPHREDRFLIDNLPEQGRMFGLPQSGVFEPDRWLDQGDRVQFGEVELEVLHCPGHTPGHIVFFHRPDKLALVGDVLFRGSIGRTDFPRGDYPSLIRSIKQRLWPLGNDVRFIPGHGPESTIGEERLSNPFVRDAV